MPKKKEELPLPEYVERPDPKTVLDELLKKYPRMFENPDDEKDKVCERNRTILSMVTELYTLNPEGHGNPMDYETYFSHQDYIKDGRAFLYRFSDGHEMLVVYNGRTSITGNNAWEIINFKEEK